MKYVDNHAMAIWSRAHPEQKKPALITMDFYYPTRLGTFKISAAFFVQDETVHMSLTPADLSRILPFSIHSQSTMRSLRSRRRFPRRHQQLQL